MEKNIKIFTSCFSYNLNNQQIDRKIEFKELSIPNYYMRSRGSNSINELIDVYLNLINKLENEITFIYDAEKYVKQYCISLAKKRKNRNYRLDLTSNNYYFSDEFNTYIKKNTSNIKLSTNNFFYFTSEFDYYITKIHKQYKKDKLKLNEYDLFFLSLVTQYEYTINSAAIKDLNQHNQELKHEFYIELKEIYFVHMYNRIINNILYLDIFIYNLKYMLFNREIFDLLHDIWKEEESRLNEQLSEDERTFMLFLYNFEFTFLSYLFYFYYNKFSYNTNVVGIDPLVKEILLIFQEIFDIDLLSKYILYQSGSLENINDPLFNHFLYLYNYCCTPFDFKSMSNCPFSLVNVVLNKSQEFEIQSYKFTLNYLTKIINGICFLNRKVDLSLDNLNILSLDFFQREFRPFLFIDKKLGAETIIHIQSGFPSLITDIRFYDLHKYHYFKNQINK